VKNLIAEIESMEVGEDLYDAKIRVLGEMVKLRPLGTGLGQI
jgi:hypothetical protein